MVELTYLAQPVIIVIKGLPCTGKSEIGRIIGQWARCPVLYIDHFLDVLSLENGYTAELLPSPDQADRLHRLSFVALCKAASDTLQWGVDIDYWNYKCIVVKSRLCSTFEINRLLDHARECGCGMILIIEFRIKNEYRLRLRLEHKVDSGGQKEWYKPRSWKDIEKAKDDYDSNIWDLHLRHLLDTGDGLPRVTRLVLDPFDDLFLLPSASLPNFTLHVINFLLRRAEVGDHDPNIGDLFREGRYAVVQYGEVGRYVREKYIRGPRSRGNCHHKYLCYACSDGCDCHIKYWEKLEVDDDDEGNPYYCGVCEEHVISGQPAYACNFCTLTLHKSCAELPGNYVTLEGYGDIEILRLYPKRLPQGHACKSCLEGGKHFSRGCRSCNFQTHLKCRVLPTILNHDCHEHSFFLQFKRAYKCKACGTDRRRFGGTYGCFICYKHYDIECLSLVRQVEHEHGGHQHLLKLTYSRHGMEEEESYWCDICYEDIDPQNWFYSCQDCPYFAAHPSCVTLSILMQGQGELLQTHPKAHL